MILTHRNVFSDLSARSLIRSDAGHRKGRPTRSESSEKTQSLSPLGRVGGRQQALEMSRIAPESTCRLASYPTRPRGDPYGSVSSRFGIRPRSILHDLALPTQLGNVRQLGSAQWSPRNSVRLGRVTVLPRRHAPRDVGILLPSGEYRPNRRTQRRSAPSVIAVPFTAKYEPPHKPHREDFLRRP
jgi:hypothetical protein